MNMVQFTETVRKIFELKIKMANFTVNFYKKKTKKAGKVKNVQTLPLFSVNSWNCRVNKY